VHFRLLFWTKRAFLTFHSSCVLRAGSRAEMRSFVEKSINEFFIRIIYFLLVYVLQFFSHIFEKLIFFILFLTESRNEKAQKHFLWKKKVDSPAPSQGAWPPKICHCPPPPHCAIVPAPPPSTSQVNAMFTIFCMITKSTNFLSKKFLYSYCFMIKYSMYLMFF